MGVSALTPQHTSGVGSEEKERPGGFKWKTVVGCEEEVMFPQSSWGTDQAFSKPSLWAGACSLEVGNDSVCNLGLFSVSQQIWDLGT